MKLFLSPHNDDEALFGAFTIIREKPLVLIVTESHIQPLRGHQIALPNIRRSESTEAMNILGASVCFLGIPDNQLNEVVLVQRLLPLKYQFEKVYAPAYYINGNDQHNIVSRAAGIVFDDRVIYYSTYRKDDLEPKGDVEIVGTPEEVELKEKAMNEYNSQIQLTPDHFRAVVGKHEYYVS